MHRRQRRKPPRAAVALTCRPFCAGQSVNHLSGTNCKGCLGYGALGDGAPSRIRTCDRPLRRRMLYPAELWAPGKNYTWGAAQGPREPAGLNGVADGSRTRHLRSHNPVLYLMSYGHHRALLKTGLPTPRGAARKLVGVERFELPTSCSQSRRATRLRYTPNCVLRRPRQPCFQERA